MQDQNTGHKCADNDGHAINDTIKVNGNDNCLSDKLNSSDSFEESNGTLAETSNGEGKCKNDANKQDQEFIFIHDTCFNVTILSPGKKSFDIQVSSGINKTKNQSLDQL